MKNTQRKSKDEEVIKIDDNVNKEEENKDQDQGEVEGNGEGNEEVLAKVTEEGQGENVGNVEDSGA